LLKLKRFMDSEAVVVGFEEQMENTNEKTVDELGHSKRSKHQAGMVGKDTLGKFLVQEVGNTPWNGLEFAIGTGDGLTADLRQHIWDNREEYLGKIITHKYQPHGTKDLPRIPVWKGFRDPGDIGE
jgi:DNA ligase-1